MKPFDTTTRLMCALGMCSVGMFSLLGAALVPAVCHAESAVKTGEKIAFLGDSITQGGANNASGYVRLVISGLEANGIKATMIPAGISGHKSNQMLERLTRDVINKKPDWMTLSCGVNDVWHGANGVPLDAYEKNIAAIVDQAQAAGIKVMILTATMIHEDATNNENKILALYNDFMRKLAAEKKCLLADLNADMQAALEPGPHHEHQLTSDGVHMNPLGDRMMARSILKSFGLSDAELQTANDAWLNAPHTCEVAGKAKLTLRQYEQLRQLAAQRGTSVGTLVQEETSKAIAALLKTAP
ncbi:MAG: SGNH/GDSL hydrolase family protein [Planctomycetes bacterium]|nr:SGNH/GDSL hydrolase family protein [Planctomycetota bacterium]